MGEVFIGSEAVAAGRLTRHELARGYRAMVRGFYTPRPQELSLCDRTTGAWLVSGRRGVIAGITAAALHGSRWVDADIPVELVATGCRPQPGIVVRDERIADDETTFVGRLPVTTPARTAFDLGRHLPRGKALERLDALMYATPFRPDDVLMLAKRYPGARGLRRLREVLPLVDGSAASPKETWLRLLLIDAGLPRPTTQIPVVERHGRLVKMLDMGWKEFMVAAEYDGDQHRTDRRQYVKDLRALPKVLRMGWIVVRVIKEDRPDDIVAGVYDAMESRGYRDAARRSLRSSATSSTFSGSSGPTTRASSRSASSGLRARQGPCR